MKPPTAALAEDCRGERCGKRRRERRQVGVRKAIAVDVSKGPGLTSTGAGNQFQDESGGCPLIGQAVSGMEATRA